MQLICNKNLSANIYKKKKIKFRSIKKYQQEKDIRSFRAYRAYVFDTAVDSLEIYPSITTFVVERSRNLNYLCPFLLTEASIDNR